MNTASRTLFIFGIYTLLNGVGLLLVPNMMLAVFQLPLTGEIWIRVSGWLICLLGFYYVAGARLNLTEFARLSVFGRVGVFIFYIAIVSLGLIKPIALVIGIIDLVGAGWTWRALRA